MNSASLRWWSIVTALAAVYAYALVYAIGWSARLVAVPSNALAPFLSRNTSVLVVTSLCHWVAVIVCAIAVVGVIHKYMNERKELATILVAVPTSAWLVYGLFSGPDWTVVQASASTQVVSALDFLKLLFTPWLVLKAMQWAAPYNQPLHPTLRASAQRG